MKQSRSVASVLLSTGTDHPDTSHQKPTQQLLGQQQLEKLLSSFKSSKKIGGLQKLEDAKICHPRKTSEIIRVDHTRKTSLLVEVKRMNHRSLDFDEGRQRKKKQSNPYSKLNQRCQDVKNAVKNLSFRLRK